MATLPSYVRFTLADFGEEPDPGLATSQPERGIPKYRATNKRIPTNIDVTMLFLTEEDTEAFETWWREEIKFGGFFTFKHPRTKQILNGRFLNGKIGKLVPITAGWGISSRSATLVYWS